ncbi:MAG: NAD(P)-binding domain-containing protein, partial [Dehalococcoidia bacterium]
MEQRVGLIGLGIMGKPMGRNLLKAGLTLTVYNRSAGPAEELEREGARRAGSPAEVARDADIVITIVTNSPDVEQVVLEKNGVIEGAHNGMV